MKKSLDKFNTFVQREYGYLYDCIDIMNKASSQNANVEDIKLNIEDYDFKFEAECCSFLDMIGD